MALWEHRSRRMVMASNRVDSVNSQAGLASNRVDLVSSQVGLASNLVGSANKLVGSANNLAGLDNSLMDLVNQLVGLVSRQMDLASNQVDLLVNHRVGAVRGPSLKGRWTISGLCPGMKLPKVRKPVRKKKWRAQRTTNGLALLARKKKKPILCW